MRYMNGKAKKSNGRRKKKRRVEMTMVKKTGSRCKINGERGN